MKKLLIALLLIPSLCFGIELDTDNNGALDSQYGGSNSTLGAEPAGTAAAAISSHEGTADPHTQYMRESVYDPDLDGYPSAAEGVNDGLGNVKSAADIKGHIDSPHAPAGAEVNVNADWNAGSGDAQVLNKPTLGTAAAKNTGTTIGTVPEAADDGSGNAVLPFLRVHLPTLGDFWANGSSIAQDGKIKAEYLQPAAGDNLGTATAANVSALFTGSGDYLKSDGTKGTPSGTGSYVATPWTYSDETCTAGQYALSEAYRYDCIASGNINRTALTDWSNPTPAGQNFLIDEAFEGVNAPSGWTAEATGIDYDYTATILEGAESFYINGIAAAATASFTGTGNLYFAARLRPTALPATSNVTILYLHDAANAIQGYLRTGDTGYLRVLPIGGTGADSAAGAIAVNTTGYVKVRYQKGTGTNATITVWTSANGSSWTQQAQSTNGTGTTDITYFKFNSTSGTGYIYDQVKVSDTDINY